MPAKFVDLVDAMSLLEITLPGQLAWCDLREGFDTVDCRLAGLASLFKEDDVDVSVSALNANLIQDLLDPDTRNREGADWPVLLSSGKERQDQINKYIWRVLIPRLDSAGDPATTLLPPGAVACNQVVSKTLKTWEYGECPADLLSEI